MSVNASIASLQEVEAKRAPELVGLTGNARVAKLREIDCEALGSNVVAAGEALFEKQRAMKRMEVCDEKSGRHTSYRADVASVLESRKHISKRRGYSVPSRRFMDNWDRIFAADKAGA